METYQSFYVNEIRLLEITINDELGAPFAPSNVYISVQNNNGIEVVAETAATIISNIANIIIGTEVTSTIGKYKVMWRLIKDTYTYYHITELEITEL